MLPGVQDLSAALNGAFVQKFRVNDAGDSPLLPERLRKEAGRADWMRLSMTTAVDEDEYWLVLGL